MKKGLLIGGLIIGIFLVSLVNVSAGVYFSNPESYYNLGDVLEIQVSVDPILEGFLKVDLVCNSAVNIFNGLPDAEGKVNIKFPLTFFYIKENSGKCYFYGEYFELNGKSREFEISKALTVKLDADSLVAKPGEEITISGNAKRLNGEGINGNVEITIPLLRLSVLNEAGTENTGLFFGKVSDGVFSVSIKLAKDTPAGNYRIDAKAFETDSLGKITSEGITMANLEILQVLSRVDVAINNPNINPRESLNFKPMLIDQAGNIIYDKASVIIRDKDLNKIFEKIVNSEETSEYKIPTNLTSGYYEIGVYSGEFSSIKKFYVKEKAIALFELKNNTLVVTNIGNIPYTKDIQIDLNGKSFIKKINLGLGEQQEFKLSGDGSYNVKVSDGENEISYDGVTLTGHIVNVESVRKGLLALNTPIVWIFFIVILGAGLLFFYRNILKGKSFAYPFERVKGKLDKLKAHKKTEVNRIGDKTIEKPPTFLPIEAEPTLVLNGYKDIAAVFALKIKNKLSKESQKALDEATQLIYNKKGAVYKKENYLIVIFTPLITRSYKNELIASKAAELVRASLKEHNKKFTEKIDFGIGINSGEIVNKIEDRKLRFTALGNLIAGAKRLAEASKEQILLTKKAYEKGGVEIKSSKQGDVYEIRKIIDDEKNKEFIDGFLKRIGMEK